MSQYGGILYLGRAGNYKFEAFQDDHVTPQGSSFSGGSDLADGDWTTKRIGVDGAADGAFTTTITARGTRGAYEGTIAATDITKLGKLQVQLGAVGTDPVTIIFDVVLPQIRRV